MPATVPDVVLQEGWDRSFAYWIIAKYKFKNSTIYNFSFRRLGEVLNISHEAARYHYRVWEREGLVRHHKDNLTFLGWTAMLPIASRSSEKRYDRRICLFVHDNVKEQLYNIHTRQVLKNINQQVRNYSVKREITEQLGLSKRRGILMSEEVVEYKKAVKKSKKFTNPEIFNSTVYLSEGRMGYLVGRSKSYAKELKKYITKYGILTIGLQKGQMVGDRMGKVEYEMRKEVDSRFVETFYWKGYAYTYPKCTFDTGSSVAMGWLSPQAVSTGLKS